MTASLALLLPVMIARTIQGIIHTLTLAQFGSLKVYCWHTLGGYWGGVSTESDEMKGLRARQVRFSCWPGGLQFDRKPHVVLDCRCNSIPPSRSWRLSRSSHGMQLPCVELGWSAPIGSRPGGCSMAFTHTWRAPASME